jgi:hypothetical protein
MDQIRTKMGDEALKIGTENPETGQTQAERRRLQAQVDTTSRPDFVGPPAPSPTPTPTPAAAANPAANTNNPNPNPNSPASGNSGNNPLGNNPTNGAPENQKAPLVPPNDVKPAEPNLPSQ